VKSPLIMIVSDPKFQLMVPGIDMAPLTVQTPFEQNASKAGLFDCFIRIFISYSQLQSENCCVQFADVGAVGVDAGEDAGAVVFEVG